MTVLFSHDEKRMDMFVHDIIIIIIRNQRIVEVRKFCWWSGKIACIIR